MAGPEQIIQIVQESEPWWRWAVATVLVPFALVFAGYVLKRRRRGLLRPPVDED